MKVNSALRLTLQSLLHLAFSAVLAVISTVALVYAADVLTNTLNLNDVRRLLIRFEGLVGLSTIMLLTLIVLTVVYFIIFQFFSYRYFDQINRTLGQMARGELPFDHNMEVKAGSPFRHTAIHMNQLSNRLHHALEEERRAEQTKNELITNVSHDLRTPLTSVLGYLGLIEQDNYRDEIELRYYVQIAYNKSQRLNVLIQDLFEYTRMRNDTITLNKVNVNLVELLGELLMQYDYQLKEAGMTAGLHAPERRLIVHADPHKLVRVFENLIANAIHYGKDGKRLDVHVRRMNNEAFVEVINYGEPISSQDLPNVFDRFYRGDKSRTDWSGGSGLGLAIAKSIIELHGGTISVSSDTQLTAFRTALPLLPTS